MTKQKFKYVHAYIQHSNAVVPEFDSRGKPDLLGWDDAVASHKPDTDPIALFYTKDYAELCKPVIDQYYESVDLNEVYEADNVDIVWQEVWEDSDVDIKFFWEHIVCVDMGFSPEDHGWDPDATDKLGNDYVWNTDHLFTQVPKFDDFVKSCQHRISGELESVREPWDISQEDAISNAVEDFNKMLSLLVKYYSKGFDHD